MPINLIQMQQDRLKTFRTLLVVMRQELENIRVIRSPTNPSGIVGGLINKMNNLHTNINETINLIDNVLDTPPDVYDTVVKVYCPDHGIITNLSDTFECNHNHEIVDEEDNHLPF